MWNNSVPNFIFRLSRFPVYRGSVLGRFYCSSFPQFTKAPKSDTRKKVSVHSEQICLEMSRRRHFFHWLYHNLKLCDCDLNLTSTSRHSPPWHLSPLHPATFLLCRSPPTSSTAVFHPRAYHQVATPSRDDLRLTYLLSSRRISGLRLPPRLLHVLPSLLPFFNPIIQGVSGK